MSLEVYIWLLFGLVLCIDEIDLARRQQRPSVEKLYWISLGLFCITVVYYTFPFLHP